MSALPRARCPLCKRSVPVRVSGELREHRFAGAPQQLCPGSGRSPVGRYSTELRAWARDQINLARERR